MKRSSVEAVLYAIGHSVALAVEAIAIVIAASRTFLSYFLDREVESTRRLQEKRQSWPLYQTGA